VHSDPEILGGTPVFVGTRIPLRNLIDYLEGGHSLDEFLDDFPSVSREQAIAALEAAHVDDLEYGTIYFTDASALIKLFIEEKGSTELRRFVSQCGVIYTTALCFGEALGVMKRKRFFEKSLSQDQYISASNNLRAHISSNIIKFVEGGDLTNRDIFFEAADLSDMHEIDLSDALQIVLVSRSKIVGATLISADKGLVEASRKSGISAWNCETEPAPPMGLRLK